MSSFTALTGNPTVLIVDDEELMREVTTIMVEEGGGRVITAVDGPNAVEVFAQNKEKIDCVFMDFSMPGMNGYQAFLKIRELSPTIGVIMVSGLNVIPEIEKLRQQGEIEFLGKPFHELDLLNAIKKVQLRK